MKNSTSVAQNSIWIMIGKVLQMLVSLVVGMLTARYLGPSDYGLINYSSSYVSFFTPIYTLGLSSILVNELIKKPNKQGEVLGSSILLRLIGSLIASVFIIVWVYCIHPSDNVLLIVTSLQCVAIFFQWSDLFNYWCQSELNSKVSVLIQLVAYLFTSIYKIWLLATGKSVVWFAFSISLDYILQAVFYLFYFKKRTGQKYSFNPMTAKELFKNSYHYILCCNSICHRNSILYNCWQGGYNS
jgi:O-antigen/teichoic acid export membrane protein